MRSLKRSQYLLISFVLCFGNSGCYAQNTLKLSEGMFITLILGLKILNIVESLILNVHLFQK